MPRYAVYFEGCIELEAESEEDAEREAPFYVDLNDFDITSVELIK